MASADLGRAVGPDPIGAAVLIALFFRTCGIFDEVAQTQPACRRATVRLLLYFDAKCVQHSSGWLIHTQCAVQENVPAAPNSCKSVP